MKKNKLQLTAALLFSCCLLSTAPVSIPTFITSYAAGSTASYQLDITPPSTNTTGVNTYISGKIQDALHNHNVVTVVGNAELTDANSNEAINIDIPQGKKVIWKATVTSSNVTYPMLALNSSANAEFELAGGKLTSDIQPALTSEPMSHVNVKITGGDINTPNYTSEHAVVLRGHGNFDMSGGSIISHSGNKQALCIISNPAGNTKVNIKGGVIFGEGDKNTDNVTDSNGNSAILITSPGTLPEVNIDADKTAIITWDVATYSSTLTRYVGGGYDSRHLTVYPGSSTRVFWSKGSDGMAAISYVKSNGKRGTINSIRAGADDISFPSLPSNLVYDNTEKGVDAVTLPRGGTVDCEYTGINGTNYPSSTAKPKAAGEYEVTATLSDEYDHLAVKLGTLKINKRAVTIKVQDQTINKDKPLPPLPQSFDDFTVENLANGDNVSDALSAVPTFSWNTDGHTAGRFNITTTTAIAYSDNYKAAATSIKGVLTVTNTNRPDNPGQATPSNPGRSGNGSSGGGSSSSGGGKGVPAKTTVTGDWLQDSKGWWYKKSDGSYPKNTWMQISYNNKTDWYYFDEEGYMQTGWRFINGKWYYMYEKTEGANVKGAMAYSTTINGYNVDSSGAWIQ